MAMAQTVRIYLQARGVGYELIAHPATGSSRETASAAHVPDDHVAKAVILADGEGHLMAVVPGSAWVRIQALEEELGRPLALAPEAEVAALLPDCSPGAIPPLGPAYGLPTVLDEALTTLARVYFEAGDHRHLVVVAGEDFRELLAGARHGFFSHPG